MSLKDNLKILCPQFNNYQNDYIELIIDITKEELISYLHITEYNTKYDSLVLQMIQEKLNKAGNEGIESVAFSGISESYESFYSERIVNQIKAKRKIKIL